MLRDSAEFVKSVSVLSHVGVVLGLCTFPKSNSNYIHKVDADKGCTVQRNRFYI